MTRPGVKIWPLAIVKFWAETEAANRGSSAAAYEIEDTMLGRIESAACKQPDGKKAICMAKERREGKKQ